MKSVLIEHDYKYAAEQIILALFPDSQKHNRSDDNATSCDELMVESKLSIGLVYAQATAIVTKGNTRCRGVARVKRDSLTNKLITDRMLQRIIKQSIFRAAIDVLEIPPVWGSLTGIRPAKLATASLEAGKSEKAAIRSLSCDYHVSHERAVMSVEAAQCALRVKRSLLTRDIALYVGIPFCPTRCAYCSFVSNSVEKSFGLIEPFTQSLLAEIDLAAETIRALGLNVIAVYFGGGTPTSLPDTNLETVMRAVNNSFDLSRIREYTVEAGRPDTITSRKIEIVKELGAGRICVNPQSFSKKVLQTIGRAHTPSDTINAVELVKKSGAAINMDVIAGLPGDTINGFSSTLETVLDLEPENVTVHTLSLKKGSRVMLENTVRPSGAMVADMLGYASHRLRESGYAPYYLYRQKYTSGGFENTGWTVPGHEGIYNICMMEELTSIFALGGGGVTKLILSEGRIERIFNAKYPREYTMNSVKTKEKYTKIKEIYHSNDIR